MEVYTFQLVIIMGLCFHRLTLAYILLAAIVHLTDSKAIVYHITFQNKGDRVVVGLIKQGGRGSSVRVPRHGTK